MNIIIGRKPSEKFENFIPFSNFENIAGDNNPIYLGIKELNRLGHIKINNESILEILSYDSLSIWWLCYGRLSDSFIKTIGFIESFENYVKKTNPISITIKDDFSKLDIIKQICEQNNILCSYSKSSYLLFLLKSKFVRLIKPLAAKLYTRRKVKSRLNLSSKIFPLVPSIKNKILYLSYPIYRRKIFNLKNSSTENGEFIFDEIHNILKNENLTLGLDLFSIIKLNNSALQERLDSKNNWIPIEMLFKSSLNKNSHKKFLENYLKLIHSKYFQSQLEYKGINYWNTISKNFFEMTYEYYIPFWLKLYDSVKNHFLKISPKAVLLIYETAPTSLAVIAACKKIGIKTIGFQHGIIHSHHPFYMHDQFFSNTNHFGFQLPDKLMLFGKIPKDILMSKGYPESQLVQYGNPMFFEIEKLKKIPRSDLLKKLYLPTNSTFVLFAPPGMYIYKNSKRNLNLEIFDKLFEVQNSNKNFFILVKPHPSDDVNDYHLRIKGNKNIKILDGDLLESILMSDIVLSSFSTSVIDALCLEKPVVKIKFDEFKIEQPYDNYDAVFESTIQEIPLMINKILENPDLCYKKNLNAKKFIKNYYNIPNENYKKILFDLIK